MAKRRKKNNPKNRYVSLFVMIVFIIFFIYKENFKEVSTSIKKDSISDKVENVPSYSLEDIPPYDGKDYVVLDNNEPHFDEEDYAKEEFEKYSELDSLGRVGVAFANVGVSLMPTEKRGSIGMIKPSGWHTVKYDSIDGKYLYNRCHLIGYQLTGENANERNLMTCTREMNTKGMLPFENQVAEYVRKTNHHVLYRVTPIYEKDYLLANGVEIEAASIEDCEVRFHVFVYNIQEGIEIDYQTGDSKQKEN